MSSDSESDNDYVPEEPEQLSEEESANEETDLQYEDEVTKNNRKRKTSEEIIGNKKVKSKNGVKKIPCLEKTVKLIEEPNNPEEDKQREEDLWAKFLEGTDSISKKTTANEPCIKKSEDKQIDNKNNNKKAEEPVTTACLSPSIKTEHKSKETKIFEFAGEKIVVEDNVIKEKIKVDSPATVAKHQAASSKKAPGVSGLSNILGQIGKKGKLSTLEKSKLDWTTYKKQEGIEEEIQSHNKGKQGYLDRRDFLERADMRQYEIERDLRLNRRSK